MKYGILAVNSGDNVDDRRESFYLMTRLNRRKRLEFLQSLITKHGLRVHAYSEVDHPRESWMDLMLLVVQYHIPLQSALADLEAFSR